VKRLGFALLILLSTRGFSATFAFDTLLNTSYGKAFEVCSRIMGTYRKSSLTRTTPIEGYFLSIPASQEPITGRYQADGDGGSFELSWGSDPANILKRATLKQVTSENGNKRHSYADTYFEVEDKNFIIWTLFLNPKFEGEGRMPKQPRRFEIDGLANPWTGQGQPAGIFLHLYAMRQHGIEYGALKKITVSKLTEPRTLVNIASVPEFQNTIQKLYKDYVREAAKENLSLGNFRIPGELVAKWFFASHYGNLIETIATQSGHRIKAVNVSDFVYMMDLEKHVSAFQLVKDKPELSPLYQERKKEGAPFFLPTEFNFSLELEAL